VSGSVTVGQMWSGMVHGSAVHASSSKMSMASRRQECSSMKCRGQALPTTLAAKLSSQSTGGGGSPPAQGGRSTSWPLGFLGPAVINSADETNGRQRGSCYGLQLLQRRRGRRWSPGNQPGCVWRLECLSKPGQICLRKLQPHG
jgi:hypothetical protein